MTVLAGGRDKSLYWVGFRVQSGNSLQIDSGQSSKGLNLKNGRGERIRTSDPLVPNQVRYQTALRPECVLRCDVDDGGVP
jgi:hypothetical protein